MKKRVLSMCMAFVLSFSMMPMTAFAEGADVVTEQEAQSSGNIADVSETEEETEAGGGSVEADTESATDESVLSVQDKIDALPAADALSIMKEDELNTAYMAIQEAYAAYDALKAEQQAQITGADCFEELFGWFNGQVAPLAKNETSNVEFGMVNEKTGEIESRTLERECEIVDTNTTALKAPMLYALKGEVKLSSLTIQGVPGDRYTYLYLGQNTTLTIEGPMTFQNGSRLFIYGPSDGSGKVIINNSSDSAAIQADSASNDSYLAVRSGELEIRSENGRITDGVSLVNGDGDKRYMEYKIDGKSVAYNENKELLGGKTITIDGTKLTLTWCEHNDATYVPTSDSQHIMNCAQCGFVGNAVDCAFSDVDGYEPDGDKGHYEKCICGNKGGTLTSHNFVTQPTDNGQYHTSRCKDCYYVEGEAGQKAHNWDITTGKCTECGFMLVAKDSLGNLYDGVKTALDAVADGNGAEYVELYSQKADDKELSEAVEFDNPGKTAELRMNGFALTNATADPTLSVKSGKLKITGTATINHTGDASAAAIAISGGELEFDGGLNVDGGLTLTGDAKLTNKLTQGTFVAPADSSAARVSVVGSNVYKNVYDLLAEGYGFYDSTTEELVGGGNDVVTLTQNVTIKEHTHEYQPVDGQDYYQCACGRTCSHSEDYRNDGKCSVCGKPCPHTNVVESTTGYICKDCDKQMLFKIEKDGSEAFGIDFRPAMNAAENGTKITLLADVAIESWRRAEISGDNKTVTLDLNGHKITGGWIDMGNSANYTSGTLKIMGNGSFETDGKYGNMYVDLKGTLDLSDWTGGTISMISMQDDPNYSESEREAGLIVGPNAGTIEKLWFGNYLPKRTKTELSGGSYGEIYVANFGSAIQLGDLLAAGYAFQNADGTYVEYTQQIGDSIINNVAVVKCPHDKIENDTCAYCGMTGIQATLDGETYTNLDQAVAAWVENGGGLKLFSEYSNDAFSFNGVTNKPLTIDLNKYNFNKGKSMSLGGADLTIKDTVKISNGTFGNLNADNGKLTLESGSLEKLSVPDDSKAAISLHGGGFGAGRIAVPVYKILEDGYYLKNSGLTVDPVAYLTENDYYRVKEAAIKAMGEKSGAIPIGENRMPIEVSLSVDRNIESDTAQVQFLWYLVKDDGVAKLAASNDVWLSANGSVSYEPGAADSKEYTEDWKELKIDATYDLVCTVIGKSSGGAYQWRTVLKGYQMTVEKANLDSEKTVITQTANSGNTGNPADNRLVVKPNALWGSLDNVTYRFDVFYNGQKLTQNTDYTIKENSIITAQNAGEYELTIVGTGNYIGEKTITWTIEPYELSGKHVTTQIGREYDGTVTADENVQGVMGLGFFEIDSNNPRNPEVVMDGASGYIDLHNSVDKTDLHFDSAEVGDRTFYFTLTLKDRNYVFADGTKTAKFELSRQKANDPAVSISKASITEPAEKEVSVANGHAATYAFDLAGMLPELNSPMKYGKVQYSMDSVILDSDYYTTENAAYIEDGKLKLPILASTQTGDVNAGTITVKVNSDNIHEFILTIHVKASDKIVPTLNGELNLSKTELSY